MKWAQWLLFIAMIGAVVATFAVPPAKGFQQPDLARIIFYHLPGAALIAPVTLLLGAWFSGRFLASRQEAWDVRAAAANELAFVFCVVTLTTGIVFSRVQWGAWWQWDARQTSFLIVTGISGAYLLLRSALPRDQRAASSAAYSLAAVLPLLFLIFVFPRLPQVVQASFHPSTTIQEGAFSPDYRGVLLGFAVVLIATCIWAYRLRVRSGLLELRVDREFSKESINGILEVDRHGAADHRVVRPVPISQSRGPQDPQP